MRSVCASEGCDFALLAGDNFYECGVWAADDAQFESEFEVPFGALGVPFYVTLGNHGYREPGEETRCGSGEAFAHERALFQVEYSNTQKTNFNLPLLAYGIEPLEGLALFSVDGHRILWGMDDDGAEGASSQWSALGPAIAAKPEAFRVVMGHYPYVSSGRHGNMGSYGSPPPEAELSCLSNRQPASEEAREAGTCLKAFYDEHVCGQADLLIGGHDHHLELSTRVEGCAGTHVLSGAGSKIRELSKGSGADFSHDSTGGFAWISVCLDEKRLEDVRFYGEQGELLFAQSTAKGGPLPCGVP
jgi:hypothetical protein